MELKDRFLKYVSFDTQSDESSETFPSTAKQVVDIGGGTTGLAILKDGKVVQIEDEPTGGTHLTLVLAGNFHVPFQEAEAIKQDYSRHKEILPVVKAVVE